MASNRATEISEAQNVFVCKTCALDPFEFLHEKKNDKHHFCET